MKIRKGFTLVEMIVVVIVLGILASIAGVQYSKIIERSRSAEARHILFTAYAGYQRRVAEGEPVTWGSINGRWGNLGMSDPSALSTRFFDYTFSNTGNKPKLIAERIGNASRTLTIYFENGTLVVTDPY